MPRQTPSNWIARRNFRGLVRSPLARTVPLPKGREVATKANVRGLWVVTEQTQFSIRVLGSWPERAAAIDFMDRTAAEAWA